MEVPQTDIRNLLKSPYRRWALVGSGPGRPTPRWAHFSPALVDALGALLVGFLRGLSVSRQNSLVFHPLKCIFSPYSCDIPCQKIRGLDPNETLNWIKKKKTQMR